MQQPVVGVDGEGGGKDELQRQHYLLLRAGPDHLLFNDNRPLHTEEILNFLCDLPQGPLYVSYYFNYDVTMILRDMAAHLQARIVTVKMEEPTLFWRGYLIGHLPSKFFSVARAVWNDGMKCPERTSPTVVINDVGPFFQCPFRKAVADWECATEDQLEEIEIGKAARPIFETITPEIISYNALECDLLAQLVVKLREACFEAGYLPARWQGPGWLAAAMLKVNKVPDRNAYQMHVPSEVQRFGNHAYYGGRFEIFYSGHVASDIYEYDINSAYPKAMETLPCLIHGDWVKTTEASDLDRAEVYIAHIKFKYSGTEVCDFPVRMKTGAILWPKSGQGWYCSSEIKAALARGKCVIRLVEAWVYKCRCDCDPFAFVDPIYEYRKSLGKARKGYALKLGLNSMYGKLCQSIGTAPYANPVWAAMVTAWCRAAMIHAYTGIADQDLVMIATDGIYTRRKLGVAIGPGLGQWEETIHHGMFFIQPGVYFYDSDKLPKTRGVPRARLTAHEQDFRKAWDEFFATVKYSNTDLFGLQVQTKDMFPKVAVPLTSFIGMRLANHRGHPETAGRWDTKPKEISFNWLTKRYGYVIEGDCIRLLAYSPPGFPATIPYHKTIGGLAVELEFADQPEMIPWSPADERL